MEATITVETGAGNRPQPLPPTTAPAVAGSNGAGRPVPSNGFHRPATDDDWLRRLAQGFRTLGNAFAVLLLDLIKEDAPELRWEELPPDDKPAAPAAGQRYLVDRWRRVVVYGPSAIMGQAAETAYNCLCGLADRFGGQLPMIDLGSRELADIKRQASSRALALGGGWEIPAFSPEAERPKGYSYLWTNTPNTAVVVPQVAAIVAVLTVLSEENERRAAERARMSEIRTVWNKTVRDAELTRAAAREEHEANRQRKLAAQANGEPDDQPGPRNMRPGRRGPGRYSTR